jgi:hypothetical protein
MSRGWLLGLLQPNPYDQWHHLASGSGWDYN